MAHDEAENYLELSYVSPASKHPRYNYSKYINIPEDVYTMKTKRGSIRKNYKLYPHHPQTDNEAVRKSITTIFNKIRVHVYDSYFKIAMGQPHFHETFGDRILFNGQFIYRVEITNGKICDKSVQDIGNINLNGTPFVFDSDVSFGIKNPSILKVEVSSDRKEINLKAGSFNGCGMVNSEGPVKLLYDGRKK